MPDPQSFNAHFGDMDANSDGLVSWDEFASYFQNAEKKVFDAVDLDQNGNIDHDEWHKFKEAHGLKHHD
jgi:Ca2+-binding EF-hand superfamily protein